MLLEVEELSVDYAGPAETVKSLDGVSLHADKGEFVAVAGPSGCGKTTLLLSCGTLLRPTRGTVRVAGEDPYALSPEARGAFRADRIGFVFQQFHLVPYLTVCENILAPAVARRLPDAEARADALIEKFRLGSRRKHVPSALSAGEKQRTALARALLRDPALVLADEPTGNLDRENAEIVIGHLAELAREEKKTVLMVTHDESALGKVDRVWRLDGGRLI